MTPPRSAVITIAHARHAHLVRQEAALAASHRHADDRIIVAMSDPGIAAVVADVRSPSAPTSLPMSMSAPTVIELACAPLRLPLAAARNLGAQEAIARGADVLIFLDVDCIPDASLVGAYVAAAVSPTTSGRILCGPVAYLPPLTDAEFARGDLDARADPHSGRPAPPRGAVELGGDHSLFWSLSFALTRDTWSAIGGFYPGYEGYGGEDTDFAWTARRRGIDLAWIGSARAYHQHHAVSDPPVEHVDDIVRNAQLFFARWREWPMRGWLDAFVRLGLVELDPTGMFHRAHPPLR